MTSSVAWHCINLDMYVKTAAGFGQKRKQEVTPYDNICDVTNELLQRPTTSWIQ